MGYAKAAIAVAALLAVLLVPVSESDAVLTITDTGGDARFDTFSGGTLEFKVKNTGSECTIDVLVKNGSTIVGKALDYPIAAEDTTIVRVEMKDFTTAGSYDLEVSCIPDGSGNEFEGQDSFRVHVTVEKNVLSNWTTYVVIIVAVIAVAIIAYMRLRDAPKRKAEMTFEQLEAERKAKMASKAGKKSAKDVPAPSTERKRYLSEKKKKGE